MHIKTFDTDLAAQTSPSGTASAGLVTSQVKIVAQPGVVSPVQDRHRLKTNKRSFYDLSNLSTNLPMGIDDIIIGG